MVHTSTMAAAVSATVAGSMSNRTPTPSICRSGTGAHHHHHHHHLHNYPQFLTPLPSPRTKILPLAKEHQSRVWLEAKLGFINRRFMRGFGQSLSTTTCSTTAMAAKNETLSSPPRPFQNAEELCKELDEVVNFLWTTATPIIEVPYTYAIADQLIPQYLPSFPPSPRATLQLLHKLDHCFASMIAGRDLRTGRALPTKQFVTTTEMVRLKGIVQRTRVAMVSLFDDLFFLEEEEERRDSSAAASEAMNLDNGVGENCERSTGADPYDDDDCDGLYRPRGAARAADSLLDLDGPRERRTNRKRKRSGSSTPDSSISSSTSHRLSSSSSASSTTPPGLTTGASSISSSSSTMGATNSAIDSDFEPEDDILYGVMPRHVPRVPQHQHHQQAIESVSVDITGEEEEGEDEEDAWLGMEIGCVYEMTMFQLGRNLATGVPTG